MFAANLRFPDHTRAFRVEDEYALLVDLGRVKCHGSRDGDAIMPAVPARTKRAVSPFALGDQRITVRCTARRRREPDQAIDLVEQKHHIFWLAKFFIRPGPDDDLALRVKRHMHLGRNIHRPDRKFFPLFDHDL